MRSLLGMGLVLAFALLGSATANAQAPEGAEPAAINQERAERAKTLEERREAAKARREAGAAEKPAMSPEDRERLVRERRARAERAGLGGTRAVRPLPGVAGQRGRVPAATPAALKVRLEQRQRGLENGHNRRMAQFRRIAELAEQSGDTEAKARVDALIAKENAMHAALVRRLASSVNAPRATRPTLATPRTVRPVPGVRPVTPRPVTPRPAAERQEPEAGGTR